MDDIALYEWYREFDSWLNHELKALDGKRRAALSIWWAQALLGRSYDYLTQHLKESDFALLVTILDKCWNWVIGTESLTDKECLSWRDAIYAISWEEDACRVVTADDEVLFSLGTGAIGSVESVVESVRTGDAKHDHGIVFEMMAVHENVATSDRETEDLITREAAKVASAVDFLKSATSLCDADRDRFAESNWRGARN